MKKFFWSILEIFEIITISVLAVVVIRLFLVQSFLVSGDSMRPNFYNGDYLLVDEITYRFRSPQRGEVIVFEPPLGGEYFIKRIIGLPNETIKIENNKIIISGNQNKSTQMILKEDYLPAGTGTAGNLDITLKKDEYFVLGDNRTFSFDSRFWGVLPGKNIIGLVKVRVWPFKTAMAFSPPVYLEP